MGLRLLFFFFLNVAHSKHISSRLAGKCRHGDIENVFLLNQKYIKSSEILPPGVMHSQLRSRDQKKVSVIPDVPKDVFFTLTSASFHHNYINSSFTPLSLLFHAFSATSLNGTDPEFNNNLVHMNHYFGTACWYCAYLRQVSCWHQCVFWLLSFFTVVVVSLVYGCKWRLTACVRRLGAVCGAEVAGRRHGLAPSICSVTTESSFFFFSCPSCTRQNCDGRNFSNKMEI